MAEEDVEALLEVEEGNVEGEEVAGFPTGTEGEAGWAEGVEDGGEALLDITALLGRKGILVAEEEAIAAQEILPANDLIAFDDIWGEPFVLEAEKEAEVGINEVKTADAELCGLCSGMAIVEINALAGTYLTTVKIMEMGGVLIAVEAA